MVVDLAVEDDDEAAVGRDHRLVAVRGEIEDGETPEAEGETGLLVDPRAAVIRTAMPQRRRHARDARDKRLGSASPGDREPRAPRNPSVHTSRRLYSHVCRPPPPHACHTSARAGSRPALLGS